MKARFIVCEACGGEGRDLRGIDDQDHGECPDCEGKRVVEIETEAAGQPEQCSRPQGCMYPHGCDFICGN